MLRPAQSQIVKALLETHGLTFAEELGIHLERGSPSGLFRFLCAALLFGARINHRIALRAAKALAEQGWTTPEKLLAASWEERARVLKRSGYARTDERTSTMLGETAKLLLERYGGDLRKLREAAGCDPARERELLKEFKGIGDVGVDIFFREVQAPWPELFPFADQVALRSAKRLRLPANAKGLAALVPRREFPRFVVALVRVELEKQHDQVLTATANRFPERLTA
jgi:endonuclease III